MKILIVEKDKHVFVEKVKELSLSETCLTLFFEKLPSLSIFDNFSILPFVINNSIVIDFTSNFQIKIVS